MEVSCHLCGELYFCAIDEEQGFCDKCKETPTQESAESSD